MSVPPYFLALLFDSHYPEPFAELVEHFGEAQSPISDVFSYAFPKRIELFHDVFSTKAHLLTQDANRAESDLEYSNPDQKMSSF